jgi:hypothetical protein
VKKTISIFFLLFLLSYAGNAHAFSFQVSPSVTDMSVDPGQTIKIVVRVENKEAVDQSFYVRPVNISDVALDGQPTFVNVGEKTDYELGSWITVSEGPYQLKAGNSLEIPVIISVPKEVSPGAHLGAVAISSESLSTEEGSDVSYSIMSLLSLRVSGAVVDDMIIREFYADKFVYSKPEIKFGFNVENSGNTLLRPQGSIAIEDYLGNKVGTVEVNKGGISAVIPKHQRLYEQSFQDNNLSIGRYTAVAVISFANIEGQKTMTRSTTFWYLPLRPILTVVGSLAVLILLIWLWMRSYIKRKLRKLDGHSSGDNEKRSSKVLFMVLAAVIFSLVFTALMFLFLS